MLLNFELIVILSLFFRKQVKIGSALLCNNPITDKINHYDHYLLQK